MTTTTVSEKELSDLGFKTAAAQTKVNRELARKLRIAFEHFRVVTPEHITRFNRELAKRTTKQTGTNYYGAITTADRLMFTPIAGYPGVPPAEVLTDLRKAKALECFDSYEVATIASVTTIPDPILFGRIEGTDNRYFISQWDNDVKIEDILRPEEG